MMIDDATKRHRVYRPQRDGERLPHGLEQLPAALLGLAQPMKDIQVKNKIIVIAALAGLSVTSALAQQPAKDGPNNNAVNSPNQNNSNAPVAGRNSFTEDQAKERITGAGFTAVSGLKKDDNGVWRGKATKNGAQSDVSVDFQGNVNPAK